LVWGVLKVTIGLVSWVEMLEGVLRSSGGLFVVVSSTGVTSGFRLRGYAGSSGRLDVIARCVIASRLASGFGFLGVLLGPPRPPRVLVVGPGCEVPGGERGVMVEISRALTRGSSGCFEVVDVDVERLIYLIDKSGFRHVILREDGANAFWRRELLGGRAAFYMGSHVDMPGWVESLVRRYGAQPVSLGPRSLHAEHAILAVLLLRGDIGRGEFNL